MAGRKQVPELSYQRPPPPIVQYRVKMSRPYVKELRPAEVVIFPHALVKHYLVAASLSEGEEAVSRVQEACRIAGDRFIIVVLDMRAANRDMEWSEKSQLQDLMWAICAGADYVCPVNTGNLSYFSIKTDWWLPAHKTLVAVYEPDSVLETSIVRKMGNLGGFWVPNGEQRIALEKHVPGYQRWISRKALELRKLIVSRQNPAIFLKPPV